ncbi:PAS domain-containing protein [Solirhodobacter olei]|uniref:PAS domain-containing protein n=1 Tax=Solirhodobacter olei TaxID=2493082 RepID=UPI000FDC2BDE|nr:PAS domain-containing protein [Solirhodobacter olei]
MERDHHQAGEVVALSEYRTLPDLPEIAIVRDYWDRLRGPRLAPSRGEVDPRGIASALPYAFILDRIAPGHARFRLAGMHVCDLLGMEVRGMPLAALFQLPAREAVTAALTDVLNGPHDLQLSLRAERGMGRPALEGQMLLLPLTDHQGALTRLFGCLVTSGTIGYPPRRFTVNGTQRRALRGVSPGAFDTAATRTARAGFDEAPAPFRARPALRLVDPDE